MPDLAGGAVVRNFARQPPFVGRRSELAVLEDRWAAALAGTPQTVFLGAEAGGGKSRLVAELASSVRDRGATVLIGGCISDLGAPYDPFVEPARDVMRLLAESTAGGPDRDPLLAALGMVADGPESAHGSGAQFSPQLFTAISSAFVLAARTTPVLLVLEDIHWAGKSALRLISWLCERARSAPLMLLATYRSTHPERTAELVRVMAELYRHETVGRIDLAGLSAEDIAEYLRIGLRAPAEIFRPAAAFLRDHTGGNPFFVTEVCRGMDGPAGLAALSRNLPTPESVRAAAESRLQRLTSGQRRMLATAAVIGEEVELPLLGESLGSAGRGDALVATVDVLIEQNWLVGGRSSTVRFPHAIGRGSVLDAMTEGQRAETHARVAMAIEDKLPAIENRVQRLAHHFSSAAALGHTHSAVRYLTEAALMARAALAHADAGDLFARAAALSASPEGRDDLRLEAARSYSHAARTAQARELNAQVALVGTSRQRLRAAVGVEASTYRQGGGGPATVDLLRAALARTAPHAADALTIRARAALGRALVMVGDPDGIATCRQAVDLARAHGDPALLASVLQVSLQDNIGVDGLADRLARADEVTVLARRLGTLHHLGAACQARCMVHYVQGRPAALEHAHRELASTVVSTGQPYWQWATVNASFAIQLISGDFEDAAASAVRAGRLLGTFESNPGDGDGPSGLEQFMLRRETGRLIEVRPLISGDEDWSQVWMPGLLALYTEFGMLDAAQRLLDRILDTDLDRLATSATWPATLVFLVEAVTALRDRTSATRLLPMATRYAGLNLLAAEFLAPFGSADRQIGCLESVLGRPTADNWFDSALDMDTVMGATVHQATTMAEHARHLQITGGSPSRIRELTERAALLAERRGMGRVLRLLEVPPPTEVGATATAQLTSRELAVLALVGRGLSNQEIADTLVISVHTAANHLRSILLKTGCSNRTQAALLAAGAAVGPGQ